MKRREFLTSSATLVGAAAFGGLTIGPSWAADQSVKGGTLIWGHSETTQNLDIHQTGTREDRLSYVGTITDAGEWQALEPPC